MAALNNIAFNCNARSGVIVSLAACSIYLFYKHIYCAHKLLKRNVYSSQTLPSSVYLVIKYLTMATCRRAGLLYTRNGMCEVAYTVLNCRLEIGQLRRWCDAAGYGWDYPDSEYRDIPLCFPEALCQRLLLMVLCDDNFRLSPTGLIRVRQSLKTLQPIDELKKGPFTLQVRVLGYQVVDGGVEVDVFLSASSRSGQPVWESIVTLLSTDKLHKDTRPLLKEDSEKEWPDSGNVKTRVQMRVPGTAGLTCVWSFLDDLPHYLLTIPARLFGYRCWSSPSVWMLSVCLAEIEKHKGTGAIRAPISVTAQFKEPLSVPGRVEITFWGTTPEEGLSSSQGITFQMEQHKTRLPNMTGFISSAS